jgi:hypothetical protein
MIVMRDPTCDEPLSEILASPAAVEAYDRSVFEELQQVTNSAIPCYRTVHKSIRVAKHGD